MKLKSSRKVKFPKQETASLMRAWAAVLAAPTDANAWASFDHELHSAYQLRKQLKLHEELKVLGRLRRSVQSRVGILQRDKESPDLVAA